MKSGIVFSTNIYNAFWELIHCPFGMCLPYVKTFPVVPYIFEPVTMTFDLLMKNFNIARTSLPKRWGFHISHVCSLCQDLPHVTMNFVHVNFYLLLKKIQHCLYLPHCKGFVSFMIRLFWWHHNNFAQATLTFAILMKNFNIAHNFHTVGDRAFIFSMALTYDETFLMEP